MKNIRIILLLSTALCLFSHCKETTVAQEAYPFTDYEKEWLTRFSENQSIPFTNAQGDTMVWKCGLIKNQILSSSDCEGHRWNRKCTVRKRNYATLAFTTTDSTFSRYNISLLKVNASISYRFGFYVLFKTPLSISYQVQNDTLNFSHSTVGNSLFAIQRYDSLLLMTRKFYNVYKLSRQGDDEVCYLTRDQGLVAYQLFKNELWVQQ